MTLVELLLYMGLMSILLVVVTDMLVGIANIKLESDSVSSVEQDGTYILNRISYDVYRAEAIAMPEVVGSSSGTLELDIGINKYTYSTSMDNLLLATSDGAYNLNSNRTTISNVSFTKYGVPGGQETIKIMFTVTSIAEKNSGKESRNFVTTLGLR